MEVGWSFRTSCSKRRASIGRAATKMLDGINVLANLPTGMDETAIRLGPCTKEVPLHGSENRGVCGPADGIWIAIESTRLGMDHYYMCSSH